MTTKLEKLMTEYLRLDIGTILMIAISAILYYFGRSLLWDIPALLIVAFLVNAAFEKETHIIVKFVKELIFCIITVPFVLAIDITLALMAAFIYLVSGFNTRSLTDRIGNAILDLNKKMGNHIALEMPMTFGALLAMFPAILIMKSLWPSAPPPTLGIALVFGVCIYLGAIIGGVLWKFEG